MGLVVFKTLRVIVELDESKLHEITDAEIYCLKCNPVTLKVFLNPSFRTNPKYMIPIRKDIEKGIIKKFIIKYKYVNFTELKELLIMIGYMGVNRFNYTKLLNKDIINIIESQDMVHFIDVGYILGKYEIKLVGVPKIIKNTYDIVDVYNITLLKDIFIGIVNKSSEEFYLFNKVNSKIDDYLKYKLFNVPLELKVSDIFEIKDYSNETIVSISIKNGTLIIDDKVFSEYNEYTLPKGKLSYDKQTSGNIETYTFSISYNIHNIIIKDELNHVVIYNTIDGIDVMIDLSKKIEELIERNKIVVLNSDLFEIILTADRRFSVQFSRPLNIKKVSIS